MKFGIELLPNTSVDKIEKYAKLAEENGFHYVWVTDHYNNRNVYVVLSLIAKATTKVLIGTGVTNPYHMNPAVIASAIATINEISNGRAILGIGAGDKVTLERIGINREKPLTRVREAVQIIRELLAGKTVTFNGEIFKFNGAKLGFKADNIPIYIGAQGPKMLKLSAELGDGVIINAAHPKDVELAMKYIDRRIDIAVCSAFSIGEKAIECVKPVVAFIVAGCPKEVLERHGINIEDAEKIKELIAKGKWDEVSKAVKDEMVNVFSISGTPEEVIARIEELKKLGIDQLIIGSPIGAKKNEAIKIIGEKIIPAFS